MLKVFEKLAKPVNPSFNADQACVPSVLYAVGILQNMANTSLVALHM